MVVLAASAGRLGPYLDAVADVLKAPATVLLVDDPRAAWRTATRRHGVHAVLASDPPLDQLTAAIRAAIAGLITLHHEALGTAFPSAHGEPGDEGTPTARECQILELMAEGLSNRMIARRLGISTYTVKFHVAAILAKLRAASRTEAVTAAIRRGLISL